MKVDKTLAERYENHLAKVCDDKILYRLCLDYFSDLADFFDGVYFTPQNFSKLKLGENVYPQEVECRVFKDKNEASAQEIFVDMFCNNIDGVKYFSLAEELANFFAGVGGRLEYGDKFTLKILKSAWRCKFSPNFDINDDLVWTDFTLKHLADADALQPKPRKFDSHAIGIARLVQKRGFNKAEGFRGLVYHELSHLFEEEIFGCGVLGYKFSGYFVRQDSKILSSFDTTGVSFEKNDKYSAAILENHSGLSDKFFELYRHYFGIANTQISETLNEEFASLLRGGLALQKSRSKDYYHAAFSRAGGVCSYDENLPTTTLLKLAIGQEKKGGLDLRFNKSGAIKALDMQKDNLKKAVVLRLAGFVNKAVFEDAEDGERYGRLLARGFDYSTIAEAEKLSTSELFMFTFGLGASIVHNANYNVRTAELKEYYYNRPNIGEEVIKLSHAILLEKIKDNMSENGRASAEDISKIESCLYLQDEQRNNASKRGTGKRLDLEIFEEIEKL